MFVKVQRTFTIGAVLFLILLFILPSLYLRRQCAALNDLSDQVLAASRAGDRERARESYVALQARYEAMRGKAELFLDHKAIDAATVPLWLMEVYLKAEDDVALEAEVRTFQQALHCLLAIETGDIRLLL